MFFQSFDHESKLIKLKIHDWQKRVLLKWVIYGAICENQYTKIPVTTILQTHKMFIVYIYHFQKFDFIMHNSFKKHNNNKHYVCVSFTENMSFK